LARFSFSLYDLDGSNVLENYEVNLLIETVYGRKIDQHEKVGKVLEKLDKNSDGKVTIDEFILFAKHYPLILYPAFTIQETLRSKIEGENYWISKMQDRTKKWKDATVFDILEIIANNNDAENFNFNSGGDGTSIFPSSPEANYNGIDDHHLKTNTVHSSTNHNIHITNISSTIPATTSHHSHTESQQDKNISSKGHYPKSNKIHDVSHK
jgi:hypothetical protein